MIKAHTGSPISGPIKSQQPACRSCREASGWRQLNGLSVVLQQAGGANESRPTPPLHKTAFANLSMQPRIQRAAKCYGLQFFLPSPLQKVSLPAFCCLPGEPRGATLRRETEIKRRNRRRNAFKRAFGSKGSARSAPLCRRGRAFPCSPPRVAY